MLLALIGSVLLKGCNQPEQLIIKGSIGDAKSLIFNNANTNHFAPGEILTYRITANAAGTIYMETDSIKEGYYDFPELNQHFYLRPGMELIFSSTKDGVQLTSHTYMNILSALYSNQSEVDITNAIRSSTFADHCARVDEHYKTHYEVLAKIQDDRLKEIETTRLQMSVLMLKALHASYYSHYDFTPEYLELFKTIKFDKDYYPIFSRWRKWLQSYFRIAARIEGKDIDKDLRMQVEYLHDITIQQAWVWDQTEHPDAYDERNYQNLLLAKQILVDKQQLESIDLTLQKVKKCRKGQPAYNFEFENETGEKVTLASLKGRYVYIDCWGVYCPACFAMMPYLNKLEEQFEHENIAFVSICLSKDEQRWKSLIEKYEIDGVKLLARDAKGINDFYNIRYIPRFILIDKDGAIISSSALRPDDKALPALLKSLL